MEPRKAGEASIDRKPEMIVKMRRVATEREIHAVEQRLSELGYNTGKLTGTDHTLIGVYGDISQLPHADISKMSGVEQLIQISRKYKRAAQKGDPLNLIYSSFNIGNVPIGDSLVVIAGPCSVESEAQIVASAHMAKEAGAHVLRGGVHKYRSSPYSGWEGIGSESKKALKEGLDLIVKAGREVDMPTAVEILDHTTIPLFEDCGVDCLQIGEPNSRNTVLLNELRNTELPVIHKRGHSLDAEEYLLWVERMMVRGKENIILCERGIRSHTKYTRNTLDLGTVAAFHYQLTGLPVAVDASHGSGIRDLVHPLSVASVFAGASVLIAEAHPNPMIAKSDGFQALYPEQLSNLIRAATAAWKLRENMKDLYIPSRALEQSYESRVDEDAAHFFGE